MLRRFFSSRRSFQGGMFLPLHQDETADAAIGAFPLPKRLRVPLAFPDGTRCVPAVRCGQGVAAKELLGRAEGAGRGVVSSPAAGKVLSLGQIDTAVSCDVPAVEILVNEPQSKGWWPNETLVEPQPNTLDALAERAERVSVFSSGSPRALISSTLRRLPEHPVHTIIVSGLESEPYVTSTRRLLLEYMESVMAVGTWLRSAAGARRLWLAVDRDDRELLERCNTHARRTPVRVCGLANKYPVGHPVLLTKAITGKVTPYGHEPFDLGVWVLNVADVIEVGCASPVVSRVVTVAGTAIADPGNYRIPLGTSYEDILRCVGVKESIGSVIDGGPMTGRALPSLDRVITQETRAVLAIERSDVLITRPGPCIRCGWCQNDCPVQLDPRALLNVVECEEWDHAGGLYPRACLECGLCSYICPSELPLAEAARRLKRMDEAP